MVQARRAKVRPVRLIIPLAVAAALLVGGSAAAWKFWPNATTAGPQAESSTTTEESQAPSTAVSSPSPSATSSPTASAASQEALAACQTRVRAADDVLKQGKIGVLHWAEHIRPRRTTSRQGHRRRNEGALQENEAEGSGGPQALQQSALKLQGP